MESLQRAGARSSRKCSARLEPFDSYWQAPVDVESGYASFAAYYRANYLPHLPEDRATRILVVSCGPGYLVDVLRQAGYSDVCGIDSDPAKVEYDASPASLPGRQAVRLPRRPGRGVRRIVPEQELNHLTLDESVEFLRLVRAALRPVGGSCCTR